MPRGTSERLPSRPREPPRPRPVGRLRVFRAPEDRLFRERAGARLRVLAISRNFDAKPP